MNCPKCGIVLNPNARFCKQCGAKIVSDENEQIQTHINQYNYSLDYSYDEKPEYNLDNLEDHQSQYDYSLDYSTEKNPEYNLDNLENHQSQYNYSVKYSQNDDSSNNSSYSYDDQDKYSYIYSKFNLEQQSSADEKYVEKFVGPNYSSIKNLKFSFPALILGMFYLLYRKMYNYAFIYFLFMILAYTCLGQTAIIIMLAINLVLAFKFKRMYMDFADKKIEVIKQSNFDKTSLELLDECQKKGGVNLGLTITLLIISYVISNIITILYEEFILFS